MNTSRYLLSVLLLSCAPAFGGQPAPPQLLSSLTACMEIDRLELLSSKPPTLRGRIVQLRHRGECGCPSALVAYQVFAGDSPGQPLAYGRFLPPAEGSLLLPLPGAEAFSQDIQIQFTCAAPD